MIEENTKRTVKVIGVSKRKEENEPSQEIKESVEVEAKEDFVDMDEFFRECKINGINAYASFTPLYYEDDIILLGEDPKTVIEFCKENNIKIMFYYMDFPEIGNYVVDPVIIEKKLTEQFNRSTQYCFFENVDVKEFFMPVLDAVLDEVRDILTRQRQELIGYDDSVPYIYNFYALHEGRKIGVIIGDHSEDILDEMMTVKEIYSSYSDKLMSLVSEKRDEARRQNEIVREQKKNEYMNALAEIEGFLKEDPKLMTMKYKNARQDYADKLRMEWGKKIDQTITRKDVVSIMERVYIERKEI